MTDSSTRQVFKGFLGGAAFLTKKGYQGKKLDSLWARQLIESMDNDDQEIAEVALSSIIADKHAIVYGGEYGSPFSIGGYGIHAIGQFDQQFSMLKELEHKNAVGVHYLSEDEWKVVDIGLKRFSQYGAARFNKICRGYDSILIVTILSYHSICF